jgi:FkbM family methyltransferase
MSFAPKGVEETRSDKLARCCETDYSFGMRTAHKIAIAKTLYLAVSAARKVVGRPDRVVTTRKGLCYELDLREGIDLAIYLLGAFEPSTCRALAAHVRPGMTVLDIGANIGSHTLHLARLVGSSGRVYAFEPTAFAYAKLLRSLSLNPELQSRVIAYQCFLTSEGFNSLPTNVYSSWPLAGRHNVHPKHLGKEKSTVGAQMKTLDRIMSENGDPAVHLIKIDVDGFEYDVFSGAKSILSRHRPTLVMELSPYILAERGRSAEELISFLLSYGYRFFDEKKDKEIRSDRASISRMVHDGESVNIVARVAR